MPRWFWVGLAIAGGLSFLAGGPPDLTIVGVVVGLHGLLTWLRVTVLALLLALLALTVGWTTPLAELAPGLSRLLAPLRRVRVPVDELVTTVALSVRCLPLLGEEVRILRAARRVRQPVVPTGLRARVRDVNDLLTTALVCSVRRAQEMADAIVARGGHGPVASQPLNLGARDGIALGIIAAAVVSMLAAPR
jgi:energy-coupling factor transporter transmembrane protein EcfT